PTHSVGRKPQRLAITGAPLPPLPLAIVVEGRFSGNSDFLTLRQASKRSYPNSYGHWKDKDEEKEWAKIDKSSKKGSSLLRGRKKLEFFVQKQ
ncbi:hypothetical protein CR513_39205, partial [Mucuna pruriens]